ncbi:MAG: AAA family ATPase [Omnitrophica WOR_2 bacterium RIFCSPHIGHO2_02_FULL_68_15]|nr:MAG: AAA family ATPase [Omnitrophica WOR_2 bacterium RIFCSPHIGHO2_02_FULL_68_15]
MIPRSLHLPHPARESFFLWGPRQTGKSLLLKTTYPDAHWYDLLKTDLYVRLLEQPHLLREELLQAKADRTARFAVIDEIQKIPALLDEVHWLIENAGFTFGLCGSSARKVRRGHANLLGGRAVRYELFGFASDELGADFDLVRMLNRGYLPRHYLSPSADRLLRAYVNDYLKEEVVAEALVRNLQAFANFLTAAALSDTELLNYATIARDCGVAAPTVKAYFQILFDTMLARPLEAYRKRPKRRVIGAPKLYFSDVGVVNHLAKRGGLQPGAELFGKAFENWVFHEVSAHRAYSGLEYDVSYWRLASGIEVDFILGDMAVAIEAKATARVTSDHLRGLRELSHDHPTVKRRVLVSLEARPRRTEDGIEILPYAAFAKQLWSGALIPVR